MALWYINPTISNGEESDSFVGEFGVGKLRNSWADVTWVAGDRYYQRADSEYAGKIDVTAGGADESSRVILGMYGAGAKPKINGSGQTRCINVFATQNYVTVQDLELFGASSGATRCLSFGSNGTSVSDYINILRCVIHDPVSDGANDCNGVSGFGSFARIEDCVIYSIPTDGVWLNGYGLTVRGNRIYTVGTDGRNNGDCIQISGSGTLDTGSCSILNNHLDHTNGSFKQCIIYETTGSGIGGLIAGNVCLMASYNGVNSNTIYVGVGSVTVGGNFVQGGNYGVFLAANNCRVTGNVVVSSMRGLEQGSDKTGAVFANNTVMDCGTYGIYADNDSSAVIKNNILLRNLNGVGKEGTNSNEDYNCYFGNTTDQVNLGGTPTWGSNKFTVDPQLDARYLPTNETLRAAGTYLGGKDFYGKEFLVPTTIGAIQYFSDRSTIDRSTVDRTTTSRNVARRAIVG